MTVPSDHPDQPDPPASRPGGPEGLSRTTARGYAFMLMNTGGTQVINFAGYLALGWLLFQDDFGLYALAQTIYTAASLVQRIGVRTIVVRRNRAFHHWANPSFWMCAALGTLAALIMVAFAPFSDALFDKEGLAGLILVIAAATPLNAMTVVPEARLQGQLRFGALASMRFGANVSTMALMLIFAALDFGPYSFVLPRPIVEGARLVVLLILTKPPLRLHPELNRWRYLANDTALLTATNAAMWVQTQMDVLLLGVFHAEGVVGVYAYAYGLSRQTAVLLTNNLRDVLFPALSSIQKEPVRQAQAFLRAARIIALIGVPACFLQAAVAAPAFDVALPDKWRESIPVLQILSIGIAFRLVATPALALIRAQGRFGVLLKLTLAIGAMFMVLVGAGAPFGPVGTAFAVGVFMILSGPIQMYVAIKPGGGRLRDISRVFTKPVFAGVLTIGGAWLLGTRVPDFPGRSWALVVGLPVVGGVPYLALMRVLAPDDWNTLWGRMRDLLRRRSLPGPAPDPTVSEP